MAKKTHIKNGKVVFAATDEYLPDTRPERDDGDAEATDAVLHRMAVEDALDELDA